MNIKYFLTPAFMMLFTIAVMSQPGPMPKEARERIEAQRVAFITQRLHLTPDEASKFWPIYNEYKDSIKDMREDFERPDFETITDEEAAKLLDRRLQQEQQKLEWKRTLVTKLRKVVSAKKVLMLQAAELEFNRELLRKAQEHGRP